LVGVLVSEIKVYSLSFRESRVVNHSFMVDVFIFESEMWERDYADNFTTNEIFPTHDALFERV